MSRLTWDDILPITHSGFSIELAVPMEQRIMNILKEDREIAEKSGTEMTLMDSLEDSQHASEE